MNIDDMVLVSVDDHVVEPPDVVADLIRQGLLDVIPGSRAPSAKLSRRIARSRASSRRSANSRRSSSRTASARR